MAFFSGFSKALKGEREARFAPENLSFADRTLDAVANLSRSVKNTKMKMKSTLTGSRNKASSANMFDEEETKTAPSSEWWVGSKPAEHAQHWEESASSETASDAEAHAEVSSEDEASKAVAAFASSKQRPTVASHAHLQPQTVAQPAAARQEPEQEPQFPNDSSKKKTADAKSSSHSSKTHSEKKEKRNKSSEEMPESSPLLKHVDFQEDVWADSDDDTAKKTKAPASQKEPSRQVKADDLKKKYDSRKNDGSISSSGSAAIPAPAVATPSPALYGKKDSYDPWAESDDEDGQKKGAAAPQKNLLFLPQDRTAASGQRSGSRSASRTRDPSRSREASKVAPSEGASSRLLASKSGSATRGRSPRPSATPVDNDELNF